MHGFLLELFHDLSSYEELVVPYIHQLLEKQNEQEQQLHLVHYIEGEHYLWVFLHWAWAMHYIVFVHELSRVAAEERES